MNDQRDSLWRRTVFAVDQILAPLVVFGAAYLSVFLLLTPHLPLFQWVALLAAAAATAVAVLLWDRGRWRLGLFVPPRIAAREAAGGLLAAVLLIGSADLLILATTGIRHSIRGGIPAVEIVVVFLPAVFHEELLFRGYPFQRLWRWKPAVAIVGVSAVFALLHAANVSVSPLGLTNVFLGGVLLSLAWVRYERLWFPIGLHFGWNFMSGPVLGYEVSGYVPETSLLAVEGSGPALLAGGGFGIEGSVWMTVVELVAIAIMVRSVRRNSQSISTLGRVHAERHRDR